MGLYHNIRDQVLQFPPDIVLSDSIKHLLTGLLDKDPETRMSLLTVMSHPWVTYNGEMPLLPLCLVPHLPPDLCNSTDLLTFKCVTPIQCHFFWCSKRCCDTS